MLVNRLCKSTRALLIGSNSSSFCSISSDCAVLTPSTLATRVEGVNTTQSEEIEQNEELLEPVNSALVNLESRLSNIETLDVASAVSALAIAQQDIIELKSKVSSLELTSFLILE